LRVARSSDSGSHGVAVEKPALGESSHSIGVRAGSRPNPSPGTFFSKRSWTRSGGMATSVMPSSSP